MPRNWRSHKECEHEDSSYERWKCRAPQRHSECRHGQNVTEWKKCESRKNLMDQLINEL
ncbi:hypothetical protein [Streptomyces sp. NPDC057250]|uniref:hypothetical protein n=1 Tax=Streptomyces sp. NPDC057250 TaxID=3346068 RepID=UPI003644004B